MPRPNRIVLAALAFASLAAIAQTTDTPRPRMSPEGDRPRMPMDDQRPRMPMKPDYAKALDISPEKAAQVEAVMDRERQQMQKLHEGTRAELAKILTPEQLARLDDYLPRGPRPPMGRPPMGAQPPQAR
jgi:Spy/CpxP family protein refolding chaperone